MYGKIQARAVASEIIVLLERAATHPEKKI